MQLMRGIVDGWMGVVDAGAREVASVVGESGGAGSATMGPHFETDRAAAEEGRGVTAETMHAIYQQSTQEADAMFKQSADKFANLVSSMKQMASEMHHELDATRNELRRGVLEMPQEAAESTAQMRKVIVDQIEALAELNRIVAHHGRGLDVVSAGRASAPPPPRQEEPMPMLAAVGAPRTETRMRDSRSAANPPPPDLGRPPPPPARPPP